MAKKNVCAMCGKDIGMMSPKIVLQDGVSYRRQPYNP